MFVKNLPPDFPLEPLDRAGQLVSAGDTIRILEIPEWLVHDLPPNEAANIRACTDSLMKVEEIDEYGYFWVSLTTKETDDEYECQHFVIEPNNVLKA
jgi:hypothetical protein